MSYLFESLIYLLCNILCRNSYSRSLEFHVEIVIQINLGHDTIADIILFLTDEISEIKKIIIHASEKGSIAKSYRVNL